jgi:hypothetical protein
MVGCSKGATALQERELPRILWRHTATAAAAIKVITKQQQGETSTLTTFRFTVLINWGKKSYL